MYFTTVSKNSFNSSFPVELDSFKEQFSQILKHEHNQENVKSGFAGEIRNNTITCQKLFIDTFNFQVVIDVSAKLIQKDENLLIETSIEPREFNFQKLSILLKMSLILCIGSLVFAFVIFLASSIATSNPQILLVCFLY